MEVHQSHGIVEIFGTTADEGMEIRAKSLEEVFALAVEGFVAILFGEQLPLGSVNIQEVEVKGEDENDLLVGLVNELVYLFDAHRWVPCRARKVKIEENLLRVVLEGEPYRPGKHPVPLEVKAATYHQVEVSNVDGVWCGRVIVDI